MSSVSRPSTRELLNSEPGIFWRLSQDRRLVAYLLWHLSDSDAQSATVATGYKASQTKPSILASAVREAGQALELILKAVILKGQRAEKSDGLQSGRTGHDLVILWSDAQLPVLTDEDQRRLLLFTRSLYWFGRYPAAISEKAEKQEALRWNNRGDVSSLGWKDFERLYSTAENAYGLAFPGI